MRRRIAITSGIWMVAAVIVSTAPQTPANRPDPVTSKIASGVITLANQAITVSWRVADGKLSFVDSSDPTGKHHTPALDQAFTITLGDGRTIASGDLKIAFAPIIKDLPADPTAPQLAEHYAGKAIVIGFAHPDVAGPIEWRVVLREGAAYWRQELTIGPMREDLKLTSVTMVAAHAAGAKVDGTAQGSPVVTSDGFIAFEHPMSKCVVDADAIACSLARTVPLAAGQTLDDVRGERPRDAVAAPPRGAHVSRARARASVPAVPALQQLVRPRLLHAVHRGGRARRHQRVRPRTRAEAPRTS